MEQIVTTLNRSGCNNMSQTTVQKRTTRAFKFLQTEGVLFPKTDLKKYEEEDKS